MTNGGQPGGAVSVIFRQQVTIGLTLLSVWLAHTAALTSRAVSTNEIVLPAATGTFVVRETQHGDILLAAVVDARLEARNSYALKSYLKQRLEAKPRRLVLDLAGVELVDSSGLGALLGGLKAAAAPDVLVLVRPPPVAQKVFSVTRTDALFRWADNVEAALVNS